MANERQLSILKQGVEVWNKWRAEKPDVRIDLSGADLAEMDLNGVNFRGAVLIDAYLHEAQVGFADLSEADLRRADLIGTHLRGTNLRGASLREADLRQANLWLADLYEANLIGSNLYQARLHGADLGEVDLKGAILKESYFRNAKMGATIFGNSDLSEAIGLENIVHWAPSSISTDVFALSKGRIPEIFLRGCGLSDWEIEFVKLFNPNLRNVEFINIQDRIFDLHNRQAIQISSLFISYSHADSKFVDKVGDVLTQKGIRFWRDIHDMTAGRVEKQIDRAIRQNPTVLLVLSEHSLKSDWVEHEVRTARELEQELGRDTLCPVALDDSWKSSRWPKRVMEQIMEYNILDFSAWQDDVKFEGMFRKLIDGLELFYKG
jgi:hypothetical protein